VTNPTAGEGDTVKRRIQQYDRRVSMTAWVGGGFLALFGIAQSSVLESAPDLMKAVITTLVVVGGAFIAIARVSFEWEATKLRRDVEDDVLEESSVLSEEDHPWPARAEGMWDGALAALLIGGAVCLAGAWWPVLSAVVDTPPRLR